MNSNLYLGIDTSNYTTSLALADGDGKIIVNLKKLLPVPKSGRGLRQSDAVFSHVSQMPQLLDELKPFLKKGQVRGVGVSVTPRPVAESYMPCFRVGYMLAAGFSAALDCPLIPFSHQEGHIMAAYYGSGQDLPFPSHPFAAFHVSGGTTEILQVIPENGHLSVTCIGGTKDLHAGQAIDRIGVRLGLSFPAGPELEKMALQAKGPVPSFHVSVSDLTCHLSGLENLAGTLYDKTGDALITARYVFEYISETIRRLTLNLRAVYPGIPVLYAGGVMSSQFIRSRLKDIPDTAFSDPAYASDNACGTALLCRRSLSCPATTEGS